MPSYLNLRHSGKIKQFKWPLEQNTALQTIANAFTIKPEIILGFKDRDGKIYRLEDLFADPEETQKQSFMLLVEGDEKKNSPTRYARTINSPEKPVAEVPQVLGLILISNYSEFERTFLQNNQDGLSIIIAVNQKQQMEEITPKVSPLINHFAEKFEFFSYFYKGPNDNLITTSNSFPLVIVYSGSKRLMEIPLNTNQKSLINLLERIQTKDQPKDPRGVAQDDSIYESSPRQESDATQALLKNIEDTFAQNEITGLEYYFLRSAVLERRSNVISLFTRYLKTRDSDQLRADLRELTSPEINRRPETASNKYSKQPGFQPLKQNYMRPETSQGRDKPRNKDLSSAQEKFIQIIAELERKSLLTEHSASLIKSLILEEHPDVLRVLNSYENNVYDDQELSYRLVRLAEKLSPYIVRPTSPLPRRDELVRLVNNLVRKRLKDDNQLLLLNKLILEGDELLYSTFDVFESDRDEEDLLDTLIRIVYRYKKMGKFSNDIHASPFYSSQKVPIVENEQELFKERKASNLERPSSQGGQSYFLENRAKSRKEPRGEEGFERGASRKETRGEEGFERAASRKGTREEQAFDRIPSRKETREQVFEREGSRKNTREENAFIERVPFRKETFSPLESPQQGFDLNEVLKNSPAIKNLPADEYGAVFWMVKNKANLCKDVIYDNGGVDCIELAIPSILLLANKELSLKLKERFDDRQRVYINENKKIKNSATYAAFQCFKYDHDLEGLSKSLEEICKNMPRVDNKTPSRSYGKGQNESLQSSDPNTLHSRKESGKDHSLSSSQNFADLAVIKEEIKVISNPGSRFRPNDNDKNTFIGSDSSLGGDTYYQNTQTVTSTTTGLDAHRPTGSKYTPLLNRDSRADSFKGMFQLKLISSDSPAVNVAANNNISHVSQTKPEIHESEGTKNSLDAHLNVIIPQKSEINPFTQTFIDRFYENQGGASENLDKFKSILSKFKWLSADDIAKLEYLYENFYYELFEVIYNYDINKDLSELERRLKEDILTVDIDNISLASASPRERKRMAAYHSFKALLQNLRNEKSISEKQYKTYLYLYTEEDVTILAAYEVYQYSRDLADFIDTLLLIEKVQFFKNESKYFEDISNFNDYMEYQLKIIFSLKRYLTAETRATLEKIIRSGDTTVMTIYQDYKKGRDSKNKNNLIHKLVNFAEENMEVIKNYEKTIAQNKLNGEQKNVRRRELVENFECTKLLPEVKYFDLLYQSIDRDDELIHSIFEVYDFTRDKIDFIENVTLVYKFLYKNNIINMLKQNKERLGIPDATIEFVENMIRRKENAILGPIEFYYATKDERDFLDTVSLLLQAKKRRKGSNM